MGDVDPEILFLYRSLDLGGVLLMGILGGTIARQRHFDVMGFLFLALFSSLGGGMIRDALIGRGTVAAMAQLQYLIAGLVRTVPARRLAAPDHGLPLLGRHRDG